MYTNHSKTTITNTYQQSRFNSSFALNANHLYNLIIITCIKKGKRMPISSNRYVSITSAVGGGQVVPTRELLCRIFTKNKRVPTGAVIQYSTDTLESSLRDNFGSESDEYKRAAYYFGFISKVVTSPKNIQFARWAEVDTSAQVLGSKVATLDDLKGYAATGAIDVLLGGVSANVPVGDLSAATSYADVATILQSSMQSSGGGLSSVTVGYDATRTAFEFDTNGTADGEIELSSTVAGFLDDLGWGENATLSNGITAQTVTDVLGSSTTLNNNYGSYLFNSELTNDQIVESAIFANGRNVEFMYLLRVLSTNRATIKDLISGYASCGMVLSPIPAEYPEMMPGSLLGSLDYAKPAASAQFSFYPDDRLTPSVLDDGQADINDAIEVNYMGQTQEAGVNFSFFQKGRLTGGATAPKAMGVHANEQWFKAFVKSQFLNMFLALQQVSADETGKATGLSYLDAGVAQASSNGAISVGKALTKTQINYITQLTGNDKAYLDVQSRGYWYTLDTNATTNEMTYLLVYAKRDGVDKVVGRHSLN
jgi:hypothetical protein